MAFSIFLTLYCLFGPTPGEEEIREYRIAGFAQGTSYSISYFAEESLVSKMEVEQLFSALDSSLSIYKSYSLVSLFNRSATGVKMDVYLEEVVRKAMEISEKTNGAFDITIQPLVQAWGFGTGSSSAIPDSANVRSLMDCVGNDKIILKGNRLLKMESCVKIDVNGIAQGYSVDVIAGYLEQKGIAAYILEIGGEVMVKGKKPDQTPFAIGIEGPAKGHNYPVQQIIKPAYGAVTTSGYYRQFYESKGRRVTHLIDARTGYPVTNEVISVTVWARDAITADGYDNALVSMGIKQGLSYAEEHQEIEAYFIYKNKNGQVADTATTGFYKILIE